MAATDDCAGTTIAFYAVFFGTIESMEWSGISRESVPTTDFDTTGGDTFIPADTYDPGQLQVEIQFDEASTPPIEGAIEAVTVTFPSANTFTCDGFMTECGVSLAGAKDKMMLSGTLKFTGSVTEF